MMTLFDLLEDDRRFTDLEIHELVEIFVRLDTAQKMVIASKLGLNLAHLIKMRLDDMEKEIFKFVKKNNLLNELHSYTFEYYDTTQ